MTPIVLLALVGCTSVDPLLVDGSNQMTGPLKTIHGSSATPAIRLDPGGADQYDLFLESDPLFFGGYRYLSLGDFVRAPLYFAAGYTSFVQTQHPYDVEDEEPIDYKFYLDAGFFDAEGEYFGDLFGIGYGLDSEGDPTGFAFVGPPRVSNIVWAAGAFDLGKLTLRIGTHDSRSIASADPTTCVSDHIGDEDPLSYADKVCFFAGGLYGNNLTQDIALSDDTVSDSKPTSTAAPTSSVVRITCSDPDGCTYAPADPAMGQSLELKIVNVGYDTVTIVNSAGSVHVRGGADLALETNDTAQCLYTGSDSTGVWSCL